MKKARERAFLSEAARYEPELFRGEIVDHESPDFVMVVRDRTIGIEVMDYVRGQCPNSGSHMRREEEMQWLLVNLAQEAFQRFRDRPVFVTVYFGGEKLPRAKAIQELAAVLSDLVRPLIPPDVYATVALDREDLGEGLGRFLRKIEVQRLRADAPSAWALGPSAAFISASIGEIQRLIDHKSDKVTSYLAACDEVWLLIVAESFLRLSGHVSVSEDVRRHSYVTSFGRVMLLDRALKRVHQFQTRPQVVTVHSPDRAAPA